jgi:hypothetical protein
MDTLPKSAMSDAKWRPVHNTGTGTTWTHIYPASSNMHMRRPCTYMVRKHTYHMDTYLASSKEVRYCIRYIRLHMHIPVSIYIAWLHVCVNEGRISWQRSPVTKRSGLHHCMFAKVAWLRKGELEGGSGDESSPSQDCI